VRHETPRQREGFCIRLLILLALRIQWVPRPSRFCEVRVPRTSAAAKLRHSIPERNLRPAFIHTHWPGFVQKIETITTPPPLLRCANQASLHRIAMHIPKFLHTLLRRPYVEVVGARLPERPALRLVSKQAAFAVGPSFCAWATKRGPCAASALASRSRKSQLPVPSKAGECVPASRHTRRPRSDSARESVPESQGRCRGCPRCAEKASAGSTSE
jgi:hypothetical protein